MTQRDLPIGLDLLPDDPADWSPEQRETMERIDAEVFAGFDLHGLLVLVSALREIAAGGTPNVDDATYRRIAASLADAIETDDGRLPPR